MFRRKGKLESRLAFILAAAALAVASPFAVTTASAANMPVPSEPFSISGAMGVIANSNIYNTPGSHFFDVSKVPLQIPNPSYYVVSGNLVNGHYEYPFKLTATKGTDIAAIELANNEQDHTTII